MKVHTFRAGETLSEFVQQTTTAADLRVEYGPKDLGALLPLFVELVTD